MYLDLPSSVRYVGTGGFLGKINGMSLHVATNLFAVAHNFTYVPAINSINLKKKSINKLFPHIPMFRKRLMIGAHHPHLLIFDVFSFSFFLPDRAFRSQTPPEWAWLRNQKNQETCLPACLDFIFWVAD